MFKKIIALLLTLCTLLSAFSMTSCKKEDGSDGSMVFKGFNVWEQDFSPIRILNQFGKISLNLTEKEYVKFGAGSAKIQPSGGTFETAKPTFIIPTYSTFLGYDYGDFTKTEKISVWVYNVQENKEWIGMGLQTGPWKTGQWWDSVVRTNTMYFTLNHGWNYIEYDIDPTYLEMQSQFDIKNVLGVFFEFDYHDQFKDQIPVFYMDDLRFHYSESAVKGSTYELKSDAVAGVWEVADFEDKKQNLFTYQRTSDGSLIRMNARVINGSEQNVTAKSGTNVLEVTKHAGENNGGWPQLILSYKVFEKAFANIGSDIAEHPENYYICLDYYNASPSGHNLNVMFSAAAVNGNTNMWNNLNSAPYTWGTWEMNVATISSRISAKVTDGTLTLNQGYTEVNFGAAPGNMVFSTTGYGASEDIRTKMYLIDNIRIEKRVEQVTA